MRIALVAIFATWFASTVSAEVVTFQNGFGGYSSMQTRVFNGNNHPSPPVGAPAGFPQHNSSVTSAGTGWVDGVYFTGETSRNWVTNIRFDNIFGAGVGQIPEGAVIDSATLTVWQQNAGTPTLRAHQILVDWSEADISNFGPESATNPAGPDLGTPDPGEITSTFAPTISSTTRVGGQGGTGGEIVLDVTDDLTEFYDDPASNLGWALVSLPNTSGTQINLTSANGFADFERPLLTVSYFFPPLTPEPGSFILFGVAGIGIGSAAWWRRRSRKLDA